VLLGETVAVEGAEVPQLEITNENAGTLAVRIKDVETATELAKEQLKAFVRRGGTCIRNGKVMCLGSRDGRETASVEELKAAGLTQYVKQGAPYETTVWRKVDAARKR
jgi:hypothetical protein